MRLPYLCAIMAGLCALNATPCAVAQDVTESDVALVRLPPDGQKRWPLILVVYTLDRQPIYRADGSKDLSILIALIEKSVDPMSWNQRAKIIPHEGRLIISQTPPNHRRILALLETFADTSSKKRAVH